jgi:signal transduction histidine kinase
MQFSELRRTTTFRLTLLYGVLFAAGTLALLWLIYLRTAGYLTQRVDNILLTEADALAHSPRPGLRQRVIDDLALNGDRMNVFALFDAHAQRIVGNLEGIPPDLRIDATPMEFTLLHGQPANARLLARRLPTGEILVVGRDINQLRELRAIITSALTWSGVAILITGLGCATALSIGPLHRLRKLQTVARDIERGDLKRRMPTSGRGDELDMFATTVNNMMGEVERLMSEVKGTTEVIAHDLLSPLAGAAAQLRRLQSSEKIERQDIARVIERIEDVLERFRGILRIAELEARQRRAGFTQVDLADVINPAADLYAPLAEAAGVRLLAAPERGVRVEADPKLLFEALSNLLDNAIKFSGRGATVQVRVGKEPARPQLIVQDNGPGIPNNERGAVLQRFYRAERNRPIPGSGLGLSVVSAIVRLHGFELELQDAQPGVRAVIDCRSGALLDDTPPP